MTAGVLVDPTRSVRLAIPLGWTLADDVGAVVCQAPAAQADITGRVSAAQIRIEPADRSALVPRLSASAHRPGLGSTTQQIVADTLAHDPTAVLVDARRWFVPVGRTQPGAPAGHVEGVRMDLAHHDMTTPMITTTILVDGGHGLVLVTASVPVAHHGALTGAVEQALASLEVVGAGPQARAQVGPEDPTAELDQVDAGSWQLRIYRPAPVVMDLTSFDVFVRGSHKISPRWRPGPLAAGLVQASGVATPVGHYVRRAVTRPDQRVILQVRQADGPLRAELCADVLERRAVLRSTTPAHAAVLPGTSPSALGGIDGPESTFGLEVLDVAAVPARLAAWLGLGLAGPGQSFLLRSGDVARGVQIRSVAPGVPAQSRSFALDPWGESPLQLWTTLVTQLG